MKLLRIALEENQQDDTEILVTDNTDEVEILKANNEIEDDFDANQNTSAVLESLQMYADTVSGLIKSSSCTRETANLISFGLQQQYNRIGYKPTKVSLESMGLTIEQEHQLVLEGIGDVANRIAQKLIMPSKHIFNGIADLFKSTKSKLDKYESKLNSGKKEFNEKKQNFTETTHTGSLNDLWYHFSTDHGQPKDIVAAIHHDLEISKYILEIYPTQVIDTLKKLTSALKSGKRSTIEDITTITRNVEKLSNPGDLFKKSYLVGKPYFGVTGLEITKGSGRNVISLADNGFSKLAELATPKAIVESGSFMHGAGKVAMIYTNYLGVAIDLIFSETVTVSTEEIGDIFDLGNDYISNVKKYLSLESSLKAANDDFNAAIENLNKDCPPEAKKLIKQIEQYGNNILYCFQTPATAEIARSLKGSKYCHYLGLRMIFNAK